MVDYSKWKNIEVSDDEDETHPNIDTPSLFRWRHQARIERMEEHHKQVEDFKKKKSQHVQKMSELKARLQESQKNASGDIEKLKCTLKELEVQDDQINKEGEALALKEKQTPWNVDTISKEGFTKTIINTKPPRSRTENLTEKEQEARMKNFIKEHEKELKHFGMLRHYSDSKKYLKEHNYLVCEHTANYLVIWCINLEMEEKHELMAHVAHQTICMQYILELAKQIDRDPRECLDLFFQKIQVADADYKSSFNDELKMFKERIKTRAAEKIEEAIKEAEEEERAKRLGPGGLDPIEVLESLPDELKKCFELQDLPMLQSAIAQMEEVEARYHMKRCVDSGLWVPSSDELEREEKEAESRNEASSN